MPEMPQRSDARAGRRTAPPPAKRVVPRSTGAPDDRFFRHIVDSMRNGVIAIRRDGSVALMNDEAYRIFALTRRHDDIGRPFAEVLHDRPHAVRATARAFELRHLPHRAALRLKDIHRLLRST